MVQVLCPVLVGREHELALLEAALEAALQGQGGFAALVGEAGIGKSRLARELAFKAGARGAEVVIGRATPSGATSAYRPLTEAMAQALRAKPVLDDPRLAPWLPALAGILPLFIGDHPAVDISEAVRGEAVVHLLGTLAESNGLVVVLEDLQWADADTMAVAEYLVDNLGGQRVMCVVTARAEEPSAALELIRRNRARPGIVHVELERLDTSAVTDMVQACVPDASAELVRRVSDDADGMPLLVEELLASPGIPRSFSDTVRERLAQFDPPSRRVLDAAAILGREFDWQLLAPITGLDPDVVTRALGAAIERLLLLVDDGAFRFRHALTREAVLTELLPPLQVKLASTALVVVETLHPKLDGRWNDLAADLAGRAGNRPKAMALLTEAGRAALARGALGTAIAVLTQAAEDSGSEVADETVLLLVEALALAGRVDDAVAAARPLIDTQPGHDPSTRGRAELHLRLAQAAVQAGRWPMATENLQDARKRLGNADMPALQARISVLESEVALADGDPVLARQRAEEALAKVEGASDLRCQALEVLGRVERLTDLAAARVSFEDALFTAESAGLPVWRMRALHELGTIELFDHLGTDMLDQARASAEKVGALSTMAVIDLQLAAAGISRWSPDAAAEHARSSLEMAKALGLGVVRDKALLFLAEASALRGEDEQVEQYLAQSTSREASPSPWEGLAWGARAEARLANGDLPGATEHLDQATTILARFPHAEPAAFRALWPLLLASSGDVRARVQMERAHELGIPAFALNRGLLGYAEAVLTGRTGDSDRASALAAEADRRFVNASTWRTLARVLAAAPASEDGWGEPEAWLAQGFELFTEHGLPGLADWCGNRLPTPTADPWSRLGVTARETEVLNLVADGLANKEIATRLGMSPRTVEKHIEALLRKTGVRSRTGLAVLVTEAASQPGSPARKS